MDFIESGNPEYLRRNQLGANYADWLAPDPHTPRDLIATAYWAIVAREMKEMATALDRKTDAEKYEALYQKIADAYRKAYIQPDGSVSGDTQTAYVVSLSSGIAPETMRAAMTARLVKDIEAHGDHLTTGFLGTPFLMFVLDENGRADVAYQLLLQDTYPSWGYMVRKGATTWWERWNGDTGDPAMNSYNHYAFGSVMAWVFRRVAGIDTDVRRGISSPGDCPALRSPPAAGPCGIRLRLRNGHDRLERCGPHIHGDHTAEYDGDHWAAAWQLGAGGQWHSRLHRA